MIAGSGGASPQTAGVMAAGTPVPGAPEAVPRASSTPDLVGSVLADRYRVLRKLGEGGMGSVYLAEHTTINKRLAIKVLSSEYSHKQDLVDRFLQEARAASMIEQENVVEITDFGSTPQGSVFFVMEYLNGEDLSRTIKKEGPLPWSRVKPIMMQICTALASAHDAGIIHRDMKPENCYRITRGANSDFIKVLDFGIAKVTSDDGDGSGKGLTRTGMIFGTPEYMSPEQAKGERADHRVDIYALGVILYELLTGRVPFTADTFMGILTKHMFEAPPAPSTLMPMATIPPDVEAIVLKALQKDREYRFQSMREMMQAIQAVGSGAAPVEVVAEDVMRPMGGQTRFSTGIPISPVTDDFERPRRSPAPFIVLGALVLAGLGGLGVYLMRDDGKTPEVSGDAPVAVAGAADPTPAPPDKDPAPPTTDKAADTKEPATAPAAATKVKVIVATPGVDGTVHDERDDALLGKTNEGFDLPFGSESLGLYVRAEGYEDQLASVIPDADKTVSVSMAKAVAEPADKQPKKTAKRSKKTPKTASASTSKTSPTASATDTTPKVDPKPKQTPTSSGSSSPDLKNPFKKGG
jgi:tRNA A-37 threonylcarbamoyl transferase component Bud32